VGIRIRIVFENRHLPGLDNRKDEMFPEARIALVNRGNYPAAIWLRRLDRADGGLVSACAGGRGSRA
jgi:hypothetical protein